MEGCVFVSSLLVADFRFLGLHGEVRGFDDSCLRLLGILNCCLNILFRHQFFCLFLRIANNQLVEVNLWQFQILRSVVAIQRSACVVGLAKLAQGNMVLLLKL